MQEPAKRFFYSITNEEGNSAIKSANNFTPVSFIKIWVAVSILYELIGAQNVKEELSSVPMI